VQQGGFDLILADYTLPSFDGLSALRIVRQQLPDVPFIFVSGTLGEEVAIEALKMGATDYVFKTRLSRLVPAIHRATREAEEIAELRRSEEILREQANLLNLTHDTIFVMDMEGVIKYWNHGAEEQYGWAAEEALGKVVHDLLKTAFPIPLE
jgi:DNA-binding NtrC family response regulator